MGIASSLGKGIANGGGPVIIGISIELEVSDGGEKLEKVTEGILAPPERPA